MAQYEYYTEAVIDGDFIMTTLTQLRLSLSLYEGAAFKLLFPIGIQWSLVPPADRRGWDFYIDPSDYNLHFLELQNCAPIRSAYYVGVSFLALPITIKSLHDNLIGHYFAQLCSDLSKPDVSRKT